MFYWSPASFSWFVFKFVKDNILTSVISSFTIKHIVLLWITLSALIMATCQKQLPEVFSVRLRPSFSPEVIHMCSFRISIKLDCLCLSVEPAKLGRIWYNSPSKMKLTPSPARTFLKFLTFTPPQAGGGWDVCPVTHWTPVLPSYRNQLDWFLYEDKTWVNLNVDEGLVST